MINQSRKPITEAAFAIDFGHGPVFIPLPWIARWVLRRLLRDIPPPPKRRRRRLPLRIPTRVVLRMAAQQVVGNCRRLLR